MLPYDYPVIPPAVPEPCMMDSLFDFRTSRIQILSGLGKEALSNLLKKGDITDAEYWAAVETDTRQPLSVHLPYLQSRHGLNTVECLLKPSAMRFNRQPDAGQQRNNEYCRQSTQA